MPRGGRRLGAGRKRGSKTAKTADIAVKAAEAGITPIEYMLSVMRDETQPQSIRLQAAGMAAPYVHPRLAHITQARPSNGALEKLYARMETEGCFAKPVLEQPAPMITDAVLADSSATSATEL